MRAISLQNLGIGHIQRCHHVPKVLGEYWDCSCTSGADKKLLETM